MANAAIRARSASEGYAPTAETPPLPRTRTIIPRPCRPVALGLLAALLTAGCSRETEPATLETTVERGSVRLAVAVAPDQVRVGDAYTIALRVHTPAGYRVEFPPDEVLGDLEVRSVEAPEPRPAAEAGLLWRRTYVCDVLLSGKVEIPALTIRYGPQPPAGEEFQPAQELKSDSLTLPVVSVLTSQDTVTQPRDITGAVVPPPAPWGPWQWVAVVGVALAVVMAAVALVWWLRRLAARPVPPLPAEVLALRALAALERGDHFARGAVRAFYYELSEIVRTYIERKFGLAAPEMTKEEFLAELARNRRALPCDPATLRAFLEECDLVKYAALAPQRSDGERSLSAARAFVDATAAAAAREQARRAAHAGGDGRAEAASRKAGAGAPEPVHEGEEARV